MLTQQQKEKASFLQYSTPQQNKNPFLPYSPSKKGAKGGTQMEQARKMGSMPSTEGFFGEHEKRSGAHDYKANDYAVQEKQISGSKHGGGSSALIRHPKQGVDGETTQPSSNPEGSKVIGAGPSSFGMVDQNTIFTTNNQNRQVRVMSKRQMKSIHYSYQPATRASIITTNATGTSSIA